MTYSCFFCHFSSSRSIQFIRLLTSTVAAIAMLSACGGGGGGGDGTSQPPPPPPPECLSDFDDSDTSYAQLRGGLLYLANNQDNLNYYNLSTDQSTLFTSNGITSLTWAPSGRYLSYVEGMASPLQIYDLAQATYIDYGSLRGGAFWAPDNQTFWSIQSGDMVLVDTATKAMINIGPLPASNPFGALWNAPGDRVAVIAETEISIFSSDGTLLFQDMAAGTIAHRFFLPDLRFSPDGNYFTYIEYENSEYSLYLVALPSGAATKINTAANLPGGLNDTYLWSPSSRYILIQSEENTDNDAGTPVETRFYLYDTQTSTKQDVSSTLGPNSVSQFSWTGSGDSFVFLTHELVGPSTAEFQIYLTDAASPDVRQLISPSFGTELEIERYSQSPDGKYLAYMVDAESRGEVVYVTDTTAQCFKEISHSLLPGEELASRIDWSPSSQWLVYYPGATDYRVVAIKADGSSQTDLTPLIDPVYRGNYKFVEWLPSADGVYFTRRASESSTAIGSLNVIEIGSLQKTTITTDGTGYFGEFTILLPAY